MEIEGFLENGLLKQRLFELDFIEVPVKLVSGNFDGVLFEKGCEIWVLEAILSISSFLRVVQKHFPK